MVRCIPLLLAAALLSAGCAVTTVGGERLRVGSDAFESYVERVFREQNRLATELAFALEAEGLPAGRGRALDSAERELLEACSELNALAAARRDGESLGPLAAARAARSAPECEQAARAAERVLEG